MTAESLTPAQVLEAVADWREAIEQREAAREQGDRSTYLQDSDKALQLGQRLHVSLPSATLRAQAAALSAAQERERELREALQYYANTENYRGDGTPYEYSPTSGECNNDWGKVARIALTQTGGR